MRPRYQDNPEQDLSRIVAVEGRLKRNHLLRQGSAFACLHDYLASRVKPDTLAVIYQCEGSFAICFNAYVERSRYEAMLERKNTNDNREAQPAERTSNV